MTEGPPSSTRKSRSPGYPGIPLDAAISRARAIYQAEKKNAAPVSAIVQHWGYKPNTSSSNSALAALKKFGLLEDEGSGPDRLARLTDLALQIIHNPNPEEFIREAALKPRIHQELWQKYRANGLPSDAALKHELVMTRNFTDVGATDFIKQFHRTITYAKLDVDAELHPSSSVEEPSPPASASSTREVTTPDVQPAPVHRRPSTLGPDAHTIPIFLPGGAFVELVGAFPISEAAWDQMMRVIEAMKGGLVTPAE